MSDIQVHKNRDPEVGLVTYGMAQQLEILVAPKDKSYSVLVSYNEVLVDGDVKPRERVALYIDLDDVPEELKEEVKKHILTFLQHEGIKVNEETEIG